MNPTERLILAACGALALAIIACALWSPEPPPAAVEVEPAPLTLPPRSRGLLVTYDGGRTTIAPKVTSAAIERIRASR